MKYHLDLRTFLLVSALASPQLSFAESIQLPDIGESQHEQAQLPDLSGVLVDGNGAVLGNGESITVVNSAELLALLGSATPAVTVENTSEKLGKSNAAVSNLLTPLSAPPQYSFNNCYPFNIGSANTFSLNSAQLTCSNTYSATPIKLDSVIVGQSVGTNYNLLVYFYNHNTSALELKGGSTNTGNTDEFFSTVMPAGNYILYAVPQAGVAPINYAVGALGWSNYDAYESNENPSQATTANGASGNYVVTGNSDNPNDRDVFAYTAGSTQTVVQVRLTSTAHTLQVASGSSWVNLTPNGQTVSLTLPSAGATVYFQVRPTVGTTVNPLISYQLSMSNPPASIINYSVVGDVQPGWFPGTEVSTALTFNGTVVDQFNHAVPFAQNVVVRARTAEEGTVTESAPANASGNYSHTINLPECFGGETMLRWDYQYGVCWEVDYHDDQLHTYTFGLDAALGANVQYIHVCDATIRSDIDKSIECQ
ncbi:hypothetical protein [Cellvibrio sp. PSBB023]|uniref:hypothetical protein n=1 Tax=Cellvibrio sp. PSBB023 TaxID=1945512 RepID=UPI00098F13F6|nr:hypothetical protein [Cellvibrio sp. PSBB023]AQT61462.1 hypothetical protein B0D95_16120 [Cellvibrio sp. PSBB023]